MWKYFLAAFSLKKNTVVGPLPLNILAVACVALAGLVFHPLLVVGIGLEITYLYWLGTNPRFRAVIDGQEMEPLPDTRTKAQIYQKLEQNSRDRLKSVETKFEQIIAQYKENTTCLVVSSNADALAKLMTMYLRLLLNEQTLTQSINAAEREGLSRKVETLTADIAALSLTDAARVSKQKTLEITEQRLAALEGRKHQRIEVSSDLERIEAQLNLALETASTPVPISTSIDFISNLISTDSIGGDESASSSFYSSHLESV